MSTQRVLPTFFIIGASKSGTTSLHRYLDRHPEVAMTDPKEPDLMIGPEWRERMDAYEAMFAPGARLRGDASAVYSHPAKGPDAPRNIAELVPDARLIYLVRDPVERSIAHYRHNVTKGVEPRDIEVAIRPEDSDNDYVAASLYATVVEAYLEHFDPEQLLVIDLNDLGRARADVLARVFTHVGAAPDFWDDSFTVDHNVHGVDNLVMAPSVQRLPLSPLSQVARRLLPSSAHRRLRARVRRTIGREVRVEAPELKAHLAEVLAPQAERLRALTGQAFDQWSI